MSIPPPPPPPQPNAGMNLPPAPPASAAILPPPPSTNLAQSLPPPPPSQAVPVPLPPMAPEPRPPVAPKVAMSKGARFGLIAAVVAVIAGVAVFLGIQNRASRPSDVALLAMLEKQEGHGLLRFGNVSKKIIPEYENRVRVEFTAEARLTEALYRKAAAQELLQREYAEALAKIVQSDHVLQGRGGVRLRELAGLGEVPVDPRQVVLLKETAAKDALTVFEGQAEAVRTSAGWQIVLTDGHFLSELPQGSPRRSFGDSTWVESAELDMAALKKIVEARRAYGERAIAEAAKLAEKFAAEHRAQEQHLLALIKPGSFFAGSAKQLNTGEIQNLTLEITTLGEDTHSVTAALRNGGSWADARVFQGAWEFQDDGFLLSLNTRPNQAVAGAGPFLADYSLPVLVFRLTETGALVATVQPHELQFQHVADEGLAEFKGKLQAPFARLLAAAAPGVAYDGVVKNKHTGLTEKVILRILEQEKAGSQIVARLESPARSSCQRKLQGYLVENSYRADGAPLRLTTTAQDRARAAGEATFLGDNQNHQFPLRIEDGVISGEDYVYSLRLERANEAKLAAYAAKAAEAKARFLSVLRAGACFDGTIRHNGNLMEKARLRIAAVNQQEETTRLVVESLQSRGVYHTFAGGFDAEAGEVHLNSAGKGVYLRNASNGVPFFTRDQPFRLNLRLTDDGWEGALDLSYSSDDWTLSFPVMAKVVDAASAARDAGAGYPTQTGAYVKGADGQWLPLPTNGAKVTYGVHEVLKGVTGFLDALTKKPGEQATAPVEPDKLADLTFTGKDTPPVVDGRDVVVVFVGSIKPLPVDIVSKYPELADYPRIEMARTHTASDGKRQVDLLRIVPGVAGFRETRVAAMIEEPQPGVLVLICNGPVSTGSYAFSVNDTAYELIVK